jgi:hypothetical protein
MLERSINPAEPACWNRRHHRQAAVLEMPISAATCATGRPAAIRCTMMNLPAGVNRALA